MQVNMAVDLAKGEGDITVKSLISVKDKKVKILSVERIDNNENNTTSNRKSQKV